MNSRPPVALAALGVTVALLSICPAGRAQAAGAHDSRFQPNLEATVRYLQDAQQEDGGFAEPGTQAESDFSAWVTLALASAGINPRDQTTAKQYWVGGHSAYSYLAEHAHEASLTTDFERELLVVDAAGASPRDFGGVDLVAEILKRQLVSGENAGAFPHEAGSYTPGVNDTIFAILSLSPIHEPAVEAAVAKATRWLETQQKCDGSWLWNYEVRTDACNREERQLLPKEDPGEIDMTGAALEALNAVKHPDPEGQKQAFEYLREGETANGGLPEFLAEAEPNTASTAWAVQAMWSAGLNPETWVADAGAANAEPLDYLASMQQPDGHIRYKAGEEKYGMWMTAYVTPGFVGDPLPIPEVPYVELPAEPPPSEQAGDGGVSSQPGDGVIAAGDGTKAPLFSRPQPRSKGHTPGGVRLLSDKRSAATDKHRDPGAARKAPDPTATVASVHHPKQHKQASRKGTGGVALAGAGDGSGGGAQSSGREVKGILIGAPTGALEAGAPGLHSASAGEDRRTWLAIGVAAAALVLALLGGLVERRRPQASL